MSEKNIKLGVSLYSLTTEYITGRTSFEGCLAKARDMGYKGIEIVAAQMVPEYPYPSDKWLYEFRGLLSKYDLQPVCWSAYIDMGIRSDRDLTKEEIIQYTVNDMIYAKKAGFDLVRTQHAISPEIFKQMIPYCKDLGVKLAIEMHHPHHLHVPVWQEFMNICEKDGKGYLGVVPDFSMYQKRPHKLYIDQAIGAGFRKERLDKVIALHDVDTPLEETLKIGLRDEEKEITTEIYSKFNHPAKLEDLKRLIPSSFYMHGKFYYLEKDENDTCIPYDVILPEVERLGYKGYIASEFEGHHFDSSIDSAEQLRRFVKMANRILGY